MVRNVLSYPEGTRFAVAAPLRLSEGRTLEEQLDILQKEGFNRLIYHDKMIPIKEWLDNGNDYTDVSEISVLVDRLSVSAAKDTISRLSDSVETVRIVVLHRWRG